MSVSMSFLFDAEENFCWGHDFSISILFNTKEFSARHRGYLMLGPRPKDPVNSSC